MAKYLEGEVKFVKWSRTYFQGNRFEAMTTNIVEKVYNMMKVAKEFLMTALVDFVLNIMGQ